MFWSAEVCAQLGLMEDVEGVGDCLSGSFQVDGLSGHPADECLPRAQSSAGLRVRSGTMCVEWMVLASSGEGETWAWGQGDLV